MTENKQAGGIVGKSTALAACLLIGFMLSSMLFIVDKTEYALVTQFGQPVKIIKEPGLYFKLPEPIQVVKRFDNRLYTTESPQSEVLTGDKKNLVVDYYAMWKIEDPLKFMQTVSTENGANHRIDDIIYSEVRRQLALYALQDTLSLDRDEINQKVVEASEEKIKDYGIHIVDVKIRRMNFPDQNLGHVYDRMSAERAMMANQYRSEGQEEALKIIGETDKEKQIILSEAYNNASTITGEGDAEAAKIYAQIYDVDPDFYQFTKTLEAYKKILPNQDNQNVIITSPNNELFKYLKGKDG